MCAGHRFDVAVDQATKANMHATEQTFATIEPLIKSLFSPPPPPPPFTGVAFGVDMLRAYALGDTKVQYTYI